MGGEEVADFVDGVEERGGDGFVFEVRGKMLRDMVPECVAAFFVDAGVADDGEGTALRGDVDEHGVAVGSLVHAELHETLLGGFEGIGDLARGNPDTEFARGALLGFRDGCDDLCVVDLAEKFLVVHGVCFFLPASA